MWSSELKYLFLSACHIQSFPDFKDQYDQNVLPKLTCSPYRAVENNS